MLQSIPYCHCHDTLSFPLKTLYWHQAPSTIGCIVFVRFKGANDADKWVLEPEAKEVADYKLNALPFATELSPTKKIISNLYVSSDDYIRRSYTYHFPLHWESISGGCKWVIVVSKLYFLHVGGIADFPKATATESFIDLNALVCCSSFYFSICLSRFVWRVLNIILSPLALAWPLNWYELSSVALSILRTISHSAYEWTDVEKLTHCNRVSDKTKFNCELSGTIQGDKHHLNGEELQ